MTTDTRPHIIVLTTAFTPLIGGAEVAVQELIQRLGATFRFTVVTPRYARQHAPRDEWYGVPIIRVGWGVWWDKWWFMFTAPWQVFRVRSSAGPSLVWAIMASYAGAGALLAHVLVRMPYVLTLQEGDDLKKIERRVGFLLPLFRLIFRRACGVQAIAPFLKDWAQRMGAPHETVVIPNGVNAADFFLPEPIRVHTRLQVRAELGIPNNASVVVTVSRLVEKNGIIDLIDAMIQLPQHHLIIVGDGTLRSALEQRSVSMSARVHFVGEIAPHDVPPFLAAADLFCRPSHSEGLGICFLEAMAAGLPVVATRVGGIPSVVTHGEQGLLVAPHDVEALRAALLELEPGTQRYALMQQHGIARAAEFSWDAIAPRMGSYLTARVFFC